ncbi:MAG: AMP-binding protein [Microbacteriaceae bacterium]
MISYTEVQSESPLLEDTIGTNFEKSVAEFADRDALIDVPSARQWTYRELNRDVDRLARGLIAAGLAAGDRAGIWSPNCAEWTILQYATAKAGIILVNVNPAYRSSEVEFVVNQCGMRMLVIAPSDTHSDYVAMARAAAVNCPSLEQLVLLPQLYGGQDADAVQDAEAGPTGAGETTYDALCAGGETVPAQVLVDRMTGLDAHDAINLQYTSGTTGFPKGATLTHHNILNNGYSIGQLMNYTTDDRVVIPVPFYHCFGMVIGNLNAFSHGAATIIPSRRFSASAALQAVQDHAGTSLYGVPSMFISELALDDFGDYDLSSLRTGVMAGSPCPEETMHRVIDEMNMTEVAICYGMTETSPVSTMTGAGDTILRRTRTVGRTMPHLESKVIDPGDGQPVERNVIGELCTRGYAVMSGYWDQPDKTAEAIDAEGWMHTGDLARMDEDGYVSIEGRIKDVVIRGGENIYPLEIEEFLYQHPSIQEVQVIGVPDAKYGEELAACVILKRDATTLTATDIAEFSRGKLAHYKIPRYVELYETFPMTVSGKIRKIQLREDFTEHHPQPE